MPVTASTNSPAAEGDTPVRSRTETPTIAGKSGRLASTQAIASLPRRRIANVRASRVGRSSLSTAQCTYTITTGPVLRVCTVDYALDNGVITTSGYIDGPGKSASVTLVVNGGTGAFASARGHGRLQPTSTGSTVTLYLTG